MPTPSMDTTVLVGDHLAGRQAVLRAAGRRSASICCRTPSRSAATSSCSAIPMDIQQNYVKRVIGVPGDHITAGEQGRVSERQAADRAVRPAHLPAHRTLSRQFPGASPYGPVYDRARSRCSPSNVRERRAGGARRAAISPWATIATTRSTAATGASCRARTSSASRW